jgi:formylglycine-generating enzyme required for sulfatase activity/serine/threonine protein kinase
MPADLTRVKELFLAALEMPAHERASYLGKACAGDTALRRQIEAMLQSHENSGELLPRSPAEMLQDNGTGADGTGAFQQQVDPSATLSNQAPNESDELSFLTPSAKPEQLGRLGPYEVQKILGKGGFGLVLKGFDERLHRVVAIKVLSPAYAANGSARKRFIREARAAAAVKNEHVVGIHDVQEDAQPPYLVMEYIDGISLQDKIDKHGAFDIKQILRIGMQIAEGLAAAHKQGLVHRDIKPANILLENGVERVKITDFGLARAVDDASVTQSGTVAGTPMYMSPEQAEGLPVDHRSDLFSLGTVLYAMCTGHPPFRASGTHAVLKRVIDASPRPIREINNEIPEWLCTIVARLHSKKPQERIQSASEVAELLGQRLADVQAGRAGSDIEAGSAMRAGSVSDRDAKKNSAADASGSAGKRRWPRARSMLVVVLEVVVVVGIVLATRYWPRQQEDGGDPAPAPDGPPLAIAPFDAAQAKEFQQAWSKHLGVPVEIDNSIGMKLRLIPPGKFLMGTTDSDPDAWNDKPQHEVTLTRPFFAGAHEVTVGQFRTFVQESGYKTEAERGAGAFRPSGPSALTHDRETSWTNTGLKQAEDHPVVCVTLKDAIAFCRWLSKKEGKTYALLSEAQWEYCCRAGTETQFSFGDDPGFLDLHGWYVGNSNATTHPVGLKKPNAWGLFDMHGNVSEWTADWIGPYEKKPQRDPTGPVSGTEHSRRGGSWASLPKFCRSSWRELGNGKDGAGAWTGFRVALVGDLKAKTPPLAEPGWVQLFNGKDLTGWVPYSRKKDFDPKQVYHINGSVLLVEGKKDHCFLRTEKAYQNYELEFEFRVPPLQKQTAGCLLFLHLQSDNVLGNMLSIETNGEGLIIGPDRKDFEFKLKGKPLRAGGWNHVHLTCKGNEIGIRLNGEDLGIARCKRSEIHNGFIAILPEVNEVHYRKIKLRELPPAQPGWVQLFNGKNLDGWTGDSQYWSYRNQALVGICPAPGAATRMRLTSKELFEDFELRFEAKETGGGWGVIEFRKASNDNAVITISRNFDVIGAGDLAGSGVLAKMRRKAPRHLVDKVLKKNDFNKYSIKCVGKRLTVQVNGVTTVDEEFPMMPGKSPLGLIIVRSKTAGETSEIQFRNMEIRRLPAAEPGF